jgi:prepilin-type N-terminal cleavage/methylation domain-containing protein
MKTRIIKPNFQYGFTLIEIAIVLLVVTILLGYTVAMFPIQQELKQYRQVNREMDEIIQHLIGFAQVNGRLPCPDTNGDINSTGTGIIDGMEDTDDRIDYTVVPPVLGTDGIPDDCKAYSGFVPAGTIGIYRGIDDNGRLLDPWGQPYRYHVSNINMDTDADPLTSDPFDLVSPNGIREAGLSNVVPNLNICNTSLNASATNLTCTEAGVGGTNVVASVAAVLISSGKDRGSIPSDGTRSPIQAENLDDFHDGTNDLVYTYSTRRDVVDAEYDDVVKWISPNVLYSKMINADRLP